MITPYDCNALPGNLPKSKEGPGYPIYRKCEPSLGMVWCDYSCPKHGDDEYQNDGLSFCSYEGLIGTFFPGRCVKVPKPTTPKQPNQPVSVSTLNTPSGADMNSQLLPPLLPSVGVASINQSPRAVSTQPQNQPSLSQPVSALGVASTVSTLNAPSGADMNSQLLPPLLQPPLSSSPLLPSVGVASIDQSPRAVSTQPQNQPSSSGFPSGAEMRGRVDLNSQLLPHEFQSMKASTIGCPLQDFDLETQQNGMVPHGSSKDEIETACSKHERCYGYYEMNFWGQPLFLMTGLHPDKCSSVIYNSPTDGTNPITFHEKHQRVAQKPLCLTSTEQCIPYPLWEGNHRSGTGRLHNCCDINRNPFSRADWTNKEGLRAGDFCRKFCDPTWTPSDCRCE